MSAAVLPLSRLLHYIGFAMAIGAALAAAVLLRAAKKHIGGERNVLETAVGDVITTIELPGLFVVVFGGLLAVMANPSVLEPTGPQGPWLFVKLPLVMALFVIACVKMFNARLLQRERARSATDEECRALVKKGTTLDSLGIIIASAVLFIATFRYTLFG